MIKCVQGLLKGKFGFFPEAYAEIVDKKSAHTRDTKELGLMKDKIATRKQDIKANVESDSSDDSSNSDDSNDSDNSDDCYESNGKKSATVGAVQREREIIPAVYPKQEAVAVDYETEESESESDLQTSDHTRYYWNKNLQLNL